MNFQKLSQLEEIGRMFENQPNVDKNLRYYTKVLKQHPEQQAAIDELIAQLQVRIKATTSELEIARYRLEICELRGKWLDLDLSLQTKINYHNEWLKSQSLFNARFAELTIDCNDHFEKTLEDYKKLAAKNPELNTYLTNYEKNNYAGTIASLVQMSISKEAAVEQIKNLEKENDAIKVALAAYYEKDEDPNDPEKFIKHMEYYGQRFKNEFYLWIKATVLKSGKK